MEDSVVCIPPMSDLQKEDDRITTVFLAMSLIRGGNLNRTVTVLNSALCEIGKYSQETDGYFPPSSKAILQKLRTEAKSLHYPINERGGGNPQTFKEATESVA